MSPVTFTNVSQADDTSRTSTLQDILMTDSAFSGLHNRTVPVSADFILELWQFDTNATRSNCSVNSDCLYWRDMLGNQTGLTSAGTPARLWYEFSNTTCFPYSRVRTDDDGLEWPISGCAVRVHPGTEDCFTMSPDEIQARFNVSAGVLCGISVFYTVIRTPPPIFQVIWTWGIIGFISFLIFWVIGAFLMARRLHHNYLSYYYFRQNTISIKAKVSYFCKVFISGEQYTYADGVFRLVTSDDIVIYERAMHCVFGTEDVAGKGKRTLVFRMKGLRFSTDYANVRFHVSWSSRRDPPACNVVFRRRIPTGVRTSANIIIMPLMFLLALCRRKPHRSEFVLYGHYIFLAVFISLIWLALTSPLLFTVVAIASAPTVADSECTYPYNAIWGNLTHYPQGTLVIYFMLVIGVIIPVLMTCLPLARARPARYWQEVPDYVVLTTMERTNFIPLAQDAQIQLSRTVATNVYIPPVLPRSQGPYDSDDDSDDEMPSHPKAKTD